MYNYSIIYLLLLCNLFISFYFYIFNISNSRFKFFIYFIWALFQLIKNNFE